MEKNRVLVAVEERCMLLQCCHAAGTRIVAVPRRLASFRCHHRRSPSPSRRVFPNRGPTSTAPSKPAASTSSRRGLHGLLQFRLSLTRPPSWTLATRGGRLWSRRTLAGPGVVDGEAVGAMEPNPQTGARGSCFCRLAPKRHRFAT